MAASRQPSSFSRSVTLDNFDSAAFSTAGDGTLPLSEHLQISADLVGNPMIGQALSNLNRRVGTESQAPPNVVGQLTTHSMDLSFATQKVNLLGISTEALPEQSLSNASSTNGLFAEFDPFVEEQAGFISGLWPRKEGADSFSLTRT